MTVKEIAAKAEVSEFLVRKNVKNLGLQLGKGKVARDFNQKDSDRIIKAVSKK